MPVKRVVSVLAPSLAMPRTDMQVCSASITTATPRGLRIGVDRAGDLRGEMLLGLQTVCENIDQTRQLRQPDHAVHRRIGDVRLAVERHHVMLAVRM